LYLPNQNDLPAIAVWLRPSAVSDERRAEYSIGDAADRFARSLAQPTSM